jgi:hypothetical protein
MLAPTASALLGTGTASGGFLPANPGDSHAATRSRPAQGNPGAELDRVEFARRYLQQFVDPAFDAVRGELDHVAAIAFENYSASRKAPVTRKAGPGYADPDYDLSVDWIAAKQTIDNAQKRHEDQRRRPRILLINGSSRSEHTCPGETSKSWRMVDMAEKLCADGGAETEVLDLSRLAPEYGRHIHPARRAFRRRRRSATGRAPAIRTIHWARCRTG